MILLKTLSYYAILHCLSCTVGFAIKLDIILEHRLVEIDPDSRIGWLESDFLSQMVEPKVAEGRANNCKKVAINKLNWTTW